MLVHHHESIRRNHRIRFRMPAMYMIVQRVIRIHTPTLARQTKLVHVNAVGRGNFRFFSGCLTLLVRLVCRPLSEAILTPLCSLRFDWRGGKRACLAGSFWTTSQLLGEEAESHRFSGKLFQTSLFRQCRGCAEDTLPCRQAVWASGT